MPSETPTEKAAACGPDGSVLDVSELLGVIDGGGPGKREIDDEGDTDGDNDDEGDTDGDNDGDDEPDADVEGDGV